MKIDQAELIEFFGVLPTSQEPSEQEFFGTTIFDVELDNHHLSFSCSTIYNDVFIFLRDITPQQELLEIRLTEVEEIKIRRDQPMSVPVMCIKTGNSLTADSHSYPTQTVELSLSPKIMIKVSNYKTSISIP